MTKAIVCDRCGAVRKEGVQAMFRSWPEADELSSLWNSYDGDLRDDAELCRDCYEKMKAWMEKGI